MTPISIYERTLIMTFTTKLSKSMPSSPRKVFAEVTNLSRSKSTNAIHLIQIDPLQFIRRWSLPLAVIQDEPSKKPSKKLIQALSTMLDQLGHHFKCSNQFKPQHLNAIVLIEFPPEDMLKLTTLSNDALTQATEIWVLIRQLVGQINNPFPKNGVTDIYNTFQNIQKKCIEFKNAFDRWKNTNVDHLCSLYIQVEMDIRLTHNRPELIYGLMGQGMASLQDSVKHLLTSISPENGATTLQKKLTKFEDQWPALKWMQQTPVERHRDLWLTYAQTHKVIIPALDWDHIGFKVLVDAFKRPSPTFSDLTPALTQCLSSLDDTLPDDTMKVLNHHFSELKAQPDIENQNIHHFVEVMISKLCTAMKQHAPHIDYNDHLNELIHLKEIAEKALPKALHFILFYAEELSQFQLKKFLENRPGILQEKAIKTEQAFFKKTPISDTHRWLKHYLKTSNKGHCYYPTFGKHAITKRILSYVLTNDNQTKADLPDILRWDTSRLNRVKSQCIEAIKTLAFIQSTAYFFSHSSNAPLPKHWKDVVISSTSRQDAIDYILDVGKLPPSQSRIFQNMIANNITQTSPVYQSCIQTLTPKLHHAILFPGTHFESQKLFPIKEFNTMVNHLWLVHKPLFEFHHEHFIAHEFMKALDANTPSTPNSPVFKVIDKELKQLHTICKKISLGLAAIRLTRQYTLSMFTFINDEPELRALLNNVPNQLAPYFHAVFNSHKTPSNHQKLLKTICKNYHTRLVDTHKKIMIQNVVKFLRQELPPTLENTKKILHEVWDPLNQAHQAFHLLSKQQQNDCISHLRNAHILPNHPLTLRHSINV